MEKVVCASNPRKMSLALSDDHTLTEETIGSGGLVLHPLTRQRLQLEYERSEKVCEGEAMSSALALAWSFVIFEARPVCVVRESERERDDGGALTLNNECLVSESGWLEIEGNSASSVTR